MIQNLYRRLRGLFRELRKDADALLDSAAPRGWVEIRMIHKDTGEIHHYEKLPVEVPVFGRNVVVGFVPERSGPVYSGRDLMRRFLAPSTFPGSISGDDYRVGKMELGSGTTAETSSDYALAVPAVPSSVQTITEVDFDGTNPYVTFVAQWDESEANQSISEAMLWSLDGNHPWARKTFTAFTKTNQFTLQLRWTIRF